VLAYLKTKVEAKNEEKLQELIMYIEKHQEEIIDYDKRKKAGSGVGLNREPEDGNEVVQNQLSKNTFATDGDGVVQNQLSNNIKAEDGDGVVQNQLLNNTKAVKKVVGSGRVEKACDNVIGKRQQHKAMSWSKLGSRSLAILKMVELNSRWFDIWVPKTASNDLQRAANDPCESDKLGLAA
jgi:hypothetical protein